MEPPPETPVPGRPVRGRTTPGKEETALLEPFSGLPLECIVVPKGADQFAAALAAIRAEGAVGFDTETKPVFARGAVRPGPDIVQFATESRAFIFQLHQTGCEPYLVEILLAEDILKVGFDLRSDLGLLHKRLGIEAKAVLDLGTVFRKQGYPDTTGVRAAVGILLERNFHKSKHVTTSNWSLHDLSPRQLEYAANDAYAALQVWTALGCPPPGRSDSPGQRRTVPRPRRKRGAPPG